MRKIAKQSNCLFITDRSEAKNYFAVACVLSALCLPLFIHFLFKLNDEDSKAELIVSGLLFLLCGGLAIYFLKKRADILASSDREAAVFIFDANKKAFIDGKSGQKLASFKQCSFKVRTQKMRGKSYRVLSLKRSKDEVELVRGQQVPAAVKHLSALGIKNA